MLKQARYKYVRVHEKTDLLRPHHPALQTQRSTSVCVGVCGHTQNTMSELSLQQQKQTLVKCAADLHALINNGHW